MKLYFTKMQGCGNDYIYFDCFHQSISKPSELARRLSDRHFGIGGDGIVLICPSEKADASMRMFNADGSEGKMCGNAIRCVGKYLYENALARKSRLTVETLSGVKTLELEVENGSVAAVEVDMGKAVLTPSEIPVSLEGKRAVNVPITVDGQLYHMTCVSMGNPHCVVFTEELSSFPLEHIGPQFENAPLFPQRVNTEFVKVIDCNTLQMRVWERGSGETWACGTGACAAAVAAVENGYCRKDEFITVILKGGKLTVLYRQDGVRLKGNAVTVFKGEIEE